MGVKIYTRAGCGYCARAMKLLLKKGISFEEIDVKSDAARARLAKRTGSTTVPQIFIGRKHVGGCDDLHALDKSGELDRLLGRA